MKYKVSNGGKGSVQRPVDRKKFSDNYDLIFGQKKTDSAIKVNVGTPGHVDHG